MCINVNVTFSTIDNAILSIISTYLITSSLLKNLTCHLLYEHFLRKLCWIFVVAVIVVHSIHYSS